MDWRGIKLEESVKMAVKMNTLQQVAIGFFILCMLPLCTHLGIITFLEKPAYQSFGFELEREHREAFFKKNNIDPKSLQGSKRNPEIQARWQAAEDAWHASREYTEFQVAHQAASKDWIAYQGKVSMIHYILAVCSLLFAYLLAAPIIATSYLLTAAYFINLSSFYFIEQGAAWLGLLMFGFVLATLLWIAARRQDACQN